MRRMRIIDNPDYVGGGIFYRVHEKFMHDPELREAFECGKKEGWREAMREVEREGFGQRNFPPMFRDDRDMPPMFRDEQDWRDYEERRRRDSRGRWM